MLRTGSEHRTPGLLGKCGGRIMIGYKTEGAGLTTVDRAELGLANPNRFLQHGSEHRLKITGRTADNLEHFAGSGLLL
jgi:hypothetical protein